MASLLVDSHCHIPLLGENTNIEDVLNTAKQLDVGHMLCVSVDLDSYPQILALAQKHANIFASVGLHPNSQVEQEPLINELTDLAGSTDVVAVGETGLDYYRSEGELEWQRQRFRTHIQAAKKVQKPLIIHSREARADVIKILKEEGADTVGGVMHCFVDDWETAESAMELGFYISFSGIVTFKNAKEVQSVAKKVPLERLLIETDSPYLTPIPYRGKPNQPGYVRHVAEFLAELRNEEYTTIAQWTTANFFQLFETAKQ
jgi:TatD DNase family protein